VNSLFVECQRISGFPSLSTTLLFPNQCLKNLLSTPFSFHSFFDFYFCCCSSSFCRFNSCLFILIIDLSFIFIYNFIEALNDGTDCLVFNKTRPSRIGSIICSLGSGRSYLFYRRLPPREGFFF
jgi:hypothetical protein